MRRGLLPRIIGAWLFGYFVALLSTPAISQTASIAETIRRLQEIRLEEEDGLDPTVPPAVQPLLTQLKHQLRDLVLDTINAPPDRRETPLSIRSKILSKLKAIGVTLSEPNARSIYGHVTDIKVQQPAQHPQLMAVTITLGIACGDDTSLYLFQRGQSGWALVLALEANDYAAVNGAQGAFGYAISPPDSKRDFFIVTIDIKPWCWSCWRSIRYKVLRVGSKAYEPKVLMSQQETVYLCNDGGDYKLTIKPKGFTLKFEGDQDGGIRTQIVDYAINGNRATRRARRLKN